MKNTIILAAISFVLGSAVTAATPVEEKVSKLINVVAKLTARVATIEDDIARLKQVDNAHTAGLDVLCRKAGIPMEVRNATELKP